MRVISGKFKGRRFGPKLDKWPTRPTTDYAKESIFNVLNNLYYFENNTVLDLFGGVGGISLEFISRGVKSVTTIENYKPCVKYINKLMKDFECDDQVNVLSMDVMKYLKNNTQKYNFIFADPPYSLPQLPDIPDIVFEKDILAENGMMILEHSNLYNFSDHPHFKMSKKYGQTIVSFFE